MQAYQQLEHIFSKRFHLHHLQAICNWDEAVMMPNGGGEARAKALANLQTMLHQLLVDPHNGELIEQAKSESLDDWQQRNLTLIEKKYLDATCLPESLVHQLTEASIQCEQAWRTLRAENNWHDFKPPLENVLNLTKESAQIRAEKLGVLPYDVLLDQFSPGLTQAYLDPIFERLKSTLPELVEQIIANQKPAIIPKGPFAIEQQRELGLELMQTIGFDFNHGRLDVSHHPFCGGVPADVRITTRYNENEFISSAMGVCHETGHACYEQGLPKGWLSQPIGEALGMSVHESQSLLMEMQACRSLPFMNVMSKLAEKHFGKHRAFTAKNLHQLYTTVEKGLIRVDTDEVTYPLHVILRYELEKDFMQGKLRVADFPEAWNDKMQRYLHLSTKDNYQNGVMQDVHWPSAALGYFPAYTLGALIAAQLFQTACKAHPAIPAELETGNFNTLLHWLNQNIHQYASRYTMSELLEHASGEDLNPDYFIQHVKTRYL